MPPAAAASVPDVLRAPRTTSDQMQRNVRLRFAASGRASERSGPKKGSTNARHKHGEAVFLPQKQAATHQSELGLVEERKKNVNEAKCPPRVEGGDGQSARRDPNLINNFSV